MKRLSLAVVAAMLAVSVAHSEEHAPPGTSPTRTWDELKAETLARAERGAYPVFHLDLNDVHTALDDIHSLSPDEWGAAWMKRGDAHFERAHTAAEPATARDEYLNAWRLYSLGGWPVATSPKKAESRAKAWQAFEAYGRLADPPIESVHIPFEGKEIIITLQRPAGVAHPPVVIGIAGSDLWRDYAALTMRAFLPAGIAAITVDMPGTGNSPVSPRPGAERVYSRLIDYVKTRSDLDGDRIVVRGESWGSYWAARVGYADAARLKGVVFQSGPVDGYFQKELAGKGVPDPGVFVRLRAVAASHAGRRIGGRSLCGNACAVAEERRSDRQAVAADAGDRRLSRQPGAVLRSGIVVATRQSEIRLDQSDRPDDGTIRHRQRSMDL